MTQTIPDDCLYYLISRATLAATGALRRGLKRAGVQDVRPAYLGVLLSLWKEDGLQTTQLSRRAGLERSTMTGLLDRMERDALIRRTADPDDRRAQRIRLTERGALCRGPVNEVVDRTLIGATRGLEPEEVDQLKSLLRRLLANAKGGEER